MKTDTQQPYEFELIRNPPAGYREMPPLTSSLQSLESSLYLVSLGRYPHALVMAMTAIESALKAKFQVPETNGTKIHSLMDHAKKKFPKISEAHEKLGVGACVDTRNRIIHYGSTPKDNNTTIRDYLKTAIPYLDICYTTLFDRTMKQLLLEEIGKYLSMARKLIALADKDGYQGNVTYCLRPLDYRLRWALHEPFNTEADDTYGQVYSDCMDKLAKFTRGMNYPWPTDNSCILCPVCSTGPAAGELDFETYQKSQTIRFSKMGCSRCGFYARADEPHLAELVLADETKEHKEAMLEYLQGFSD